MLVLPVLAVAIGRAGAVLAALPLAFQYVLHLAGAVPEIDFVHGEQEGGHDVVVLRVEVVRNGDILDAVLGEKLLGVVAGLPHVAAQPAEVSLCQLNTKFFTDARGGQQVFPRPPPASALS